MKPISTVEKLNDSIRLERFRNFTSQVKKGLLPASVEQLEQVKKEVSEIVSKHYPNDRHLHEQVEEQ